MIQPIQNDSRANITRILAVVIATGIIVGVIFGIYSLFDTNDAPDSSTQQRIITAEVGDVIDSTSVRGVTAFQESSVLSFGIQGTISKVHVQKGQEVTQGETLVELHSYSIAKAELSIATEQYKLHQIQQQVSKLEALAFSVADGDGSGITAPLNPTWGTADSIAGAMMKKNELTALLSKAESELSALLEPREASIASAELEYLSLQLSLKAVQQDYDEMLATVSFPNINELDHTRARLSVLRNQRDTALADWERMVSISKSQYTQRELEEMFPSAFSNRENVRRALAEVTAQILELTALPEDELLTLKKAELSSAKAALADAEARVVRITAPYDGVVQDVYVTVNAQIKAHEAIIQVADYSQVQAKGHLHELHVLDIKPATEAFVTLDALPDRQFLGKFLHLSKVPLDNENSVSYEITVPFETDGYSTSISTGGAHFPEGLSVTIDIVVAQSNGVLRIPLHTVTGSLSLPTVTLYDDGSEVPGHPITVGIHDDYWIEVIDGLSEGDQIIGTNLESTYESQNENLIDIASSKSQ